MIQLNHPFCFGCKSKAGEIKKIYSSFYFKSYIYGIDNNFKDW